MVCLGFHRRDTPEPSYEVLFRREQGPLRETIHLRNQSEP